MPPVPDRAGDHVVQVTRTYKAGVYQFRPDGEYSAARMIGHAIRNARRFIYTECQYFTGAPALAEALLAALPNIEHLTVLLTHWELSDLPFVNSRRRRFIRTLTANPEHAHKVRIFTLQPEGNTALFQSGHERHTYVHSKVWIIDDEFAVIGSVNSNQRSWMHDSEVAVGIYDTSTDATQPRLARALRIELWQEHLNMRTAEGAAQLHDGVAGAAHWLHPPTGARVRAHDLDERNSRGKNDRVLPFPLNFIADTDLVWNNIFDPD
jgi:phosphatidylserine/phosphatidylglycerophosphate/cardiolipin synthase-like enzyme